MTAKKARYLPTETERLLIQAACFEHEAAAGAWQQWRRSHELDASDRTSIDLLPAVFRNLRNRFDFGPDGPVLQGIYRKTWVHNQVRIQSAVDILRAYEKAGIDTLLLKGAALVVHYYHDLGVRPMADVDILVPADKVEAAYGILIAAGWQPLSAPGGELAHVLRVTHSTNFVRPGAGLDLHWHVLVDNCDPGDDDGFWTFAEAINLMGVQTKCLSATDQLLHLLVHGSKWTQSRSIIWLLDAHRVLSEEGQSLDWTRFVLQANESANQLAVLQGLDWLRHELETGVPEEALKGLTSQKPGTRERLDYWSQNTEDSFAGMVQRDIAGYLKLSRRRRSLTQLRGAVWYLQAKFNVGDSRKIPSVLGQRLLRRISRNLRGRNSETTSALHPRA